MEKTRNNGNGIHQLKVLCPTHAKSQFIDNLIGRYFSFPIFLESLPDGIQSRQHPWVTRLDGAVL